jgi:hypothetical protein
LVCNAEYGDQFTINASDRTGSYGSMRLNDVSIPLTCVAIQDVNGGHALYASGTGADGKMYFATVKTTSALAGNFLISSSPDRLNCGAPEYYGTFGYGSFVITPR